MADAPKNMVTWFQLPAQDETSAWTCHERVFGWTSEDLYGPPSEGAIRGEISVRTKDFVRPRLAIRVDSLDGTLAIEASLPKRIAKPIVSTLEPARRYSRAMRDAATAGGLLLHGVETQGDRSAS